MTALDFPASPSNGDIYENYIYDGSKGVWRINPQTPGFDLESLTDTSITSPVDGQFLVYDTATSKWINDDSAIDNLGDVTITSPTDGQALVYDNATSSWVNETPASTVTSLTDTTISSPTDGDVLKYNGSAWVNEPTVINTDGDPGTKIYVGSVDPSGSYTLEAGDIWIEV
jgi:hypothetical protein